MYGGECVDCGAPTNGSDGRGPHASKRCRECGARRSGETRTVWTREKIIAAILEWVALYGEPPAIPDWHPYAAEHQLSDAKRAARFRGGDWPSAESVIREFGSWNAGIAAAGFTPRARHGGDGNQLRRRTAKAAA